MKTMATILLAAAAAFAGETAEDAARKLETKVSLDFQNARLTDALAVLRGATGLNFVAIEGAETIVTLRVRDLSAKSSLKLLLQPAGLGAAFEHGGVVIRSRENLGGTPTLRIYDVRGTLLKLKDHPGFRIELQGRRPLCGIGCFPVFDEGPVRWLDEETLVSLVRAETGGSSWDENPRAGMTLTAGRLYVTQTARVHREIESLLARLPL
jgi:hypothetical protein